MKRMPPAARRELLLDAAFRVIARGGVSAATTRAVCAEAGMPLASFHYVFESQNEFMHELARRVIAEVGDVRRFPELTTDLYRNVEMMLLSTFEWAVEHPDEELAYYELSNYTLRTPGMEHFGLQRIEFGLELITRTFHIIDAIHEDHTTVVDLSHLAWLVMTFIEGNATMYLNTKDAPSVRTAIRAFAVMIVEYARGATLDPGGEGSRAT